MACLQVDGHSHVVHSEEESLGTRLMIDSLNCLLANETDPSRLLAISPGKLIKCLVADGAHVEPDQPFAEIEVIASASLHYNWQLHIIAKHYHDDRHGFFGWCMRNDRKSQKHLHPYLN